MNYFALVLYMGLCGLIAWDAEKLRKKYGEKVGAVAGWVWFIGCLLLNPLMIVYVIVRARYYYKHEQPEDGPNGDLIRYGTGMAAVLMVISFFMVWGEAAFMTANYFELWEGVFDHAGRINRYAGSNNLMQIMAGLALPPAVALVVAFGASKSGRFSHVALYAGVAGVLAAWQLHDYLAGGSIIDMTDALGAGFKLFTIACATATGIGIWGITDLHHSSEASLAGRSEFGTPAARLQELADLHESGLITDEEFQEKRESVLQDVG